MAANSDNIVLIGKKPTVSYVLAVMTQFTNGKSEVHIKARGKAISKAVDVVEIVKRRFTSDLKVKNIEIGTEEREVGDRKVSVSTISITIAK